VAQIKSLEWTGADQGRHTRFVGLRDDKIPSRWFREHRRVFSARPGPAFDDLHPEYSCRSVGGNQTVAVNFRSHRSDGLGWTQWVPCRHDKHFGVRSGFLAPHPCIHQWTPSTRLARSIDDTQYCACSRIVLSSNAIWEALAGGGALLASFLEGSGEA
jgi:hypothetical protein